MLLELLLVIMAVVDQVRRRRKTRGLDQRRRRRRTRRGRGQRRRRRRRKVREVGRQEVPPAALDQTQTDLMLSLYPKCIFLILEWFRVANTQFL